MLHVHLILLPVVFPHKLQKEVWVKRAGCPLDGGFARDQELGDYNVVLLGLGYLEDVGSFV